MKNFNDKLNEKGWSSSRHDRYKWG